MREGGARHTAVQMECGVTAAGSVSTDILTTTLLLDFRVTTSLLLHYYLKIGKFKSLCAQGVARLATTAGQTLGALGERRRLKT